MGVAARSFGAAVTFFLFAADFVVFFFLFAFFRGKDIFAALFGGNDLVFVDVLDLRHPALVVAVAGVQRLLFENKFFVARNFADSVQVVGNRMVVHLLFLEHLMLEGAAFGRGLGSGELLRRLQLEISSGGIDLVLDFIVSFMLGLSFGVLPEVLRGLIFDDGPVIFDCGFVEFYRTGSGLMGSSGYSVTLGRGNGLFWLLSETCRNGFGLGSSSIATPSSETATARTRLLLFHDGSGFSNRSGFDRLLLNRGGRFRLHGFGYIEALIEVRRFFLNLFFDGTGGDKILDREAGNIVVIYFDSARRLGLWEIAILGNRFAGQNDRRISGWRSVGLTRARFRARLMSRFETRFGA